MQLRFILSLFKLSVLIRAIRDKKIPPQAESVAISY
jgi:hypothetical protein